MTRLPLALVFTLIACSDVRTELVPLELSGPAGADAGQGGAGGAGNDAAVATDSGAPAALCGNRVCRCADEKDNDRDELIDGLDPECTSRIDDDEESFAITSGKNPLHACEDCFWDGNASAEDDGCMYPDACRSEGPTAMPGPPAMVPPAAMMCRTCEVAPRCTDTCRRQTPNGCDCFGCCAITGDDGAAVNVILSDDCSLKHIDNEERCPRCVPNPDCYNPCGPCEQCFGRRAEDIPASCADGSSTSEPAHQCDEGYKACSAAAPCPEEFYCLLGCCMVTVF